ncbi:LSAMP [Mytilus coruscus]|uniref:LSAMP n=1 Tax=Mytilus coruscus TaxID=42192 RepID=A0A6J8EVX2_MYTCO|nr:LSAMP [Mytilus coruscus]
MDKSYLRLVWIIIAMWTSKGGSTNYPKHITHLYAKYGNSVILKCLNNTNFTSWDGPSSKSSYGYNETPYAANDQIEQQLPNAKNLMVVGDKSVGEYNLQIINLTQREEGYYKCNAKRGNTVSELRFWLKIKVPPIWLSTNAENGTLVGTAGDNMNLTCRVRTELFENETKINLTMYHDEYIVEESENEVIIHSFVPESTYNRNIFKCVVESLQLDVPLREIMVLDIKYRPSLRFDRHEQNLTVYEGTDFRLTCFAESNPVTTEIFWKANGKQIKQEVEHHTSVLLNIVNIKRHHEGNYTCVAKNEVGNVYQSIYIRVLYEKPVETQMYQLRDYIADYGANPQSHIAVGKQDNRMESSDGRVFQSRVDSQGNNALNYAEICFPPGSSEARCVVHGKENITIYSDVVLPIVETTI